MIDKKYSVELEVVTPLSIGSGNDWACGADYVQHEGKVYILDISKVAEAGIDLDTISQLFLKSDEAGICRLIGSQLKDVSRFVFSSPINTSNPIKTFVRSQLYDKPLVVGSSLKGAIRSILFKHLRELEETNEAVFGKMKDGTDFMRFIHVGDIELPKTILLNSKIFNLHQEDDGRWVGGWKHGRSNTTEQFRPNGFNTLYECAQPGDKGCGTIVIASNVHNLLMNQQRVQYAEKRTRLMQEGLPLLFKIINQHTRNYLQKERAFFETYPADHSEKILECIDYLLSMIPADNSYCLLKMSAGVGYHSITGDWRFSDYSASVNNPDNGKRYKSRKTIQYKDAIQLMGFIKLREMTTEEVLEAQSSLNKSHQSILNAISEKGEMQENLRKEAIRKKKEIEDAKREAQQQQEEYSHLLDEARRYLLEEQWEKAIEFAKQALSLNPSSVDASSLITNAQKSKSIDEFKKNESKKVQEALAQPLSELLKGKTSSIGNLLNTTSKWLKANNVEFGEDEYKAIFNALQYLPEKEKKNIQKKRKDFVKCMGEAFASRLFEK